MSGWPKEENRIKPKAEMVVLYDGVCGFCRFCVAVILWWDKGHRLYPAEIQSPYGQQLLADVMPADRLRSAHLVTTDGIVRSGAQAAPTLFLALPYGSMIARVTSRLMPLTVRAYDVVTHSRGLAGCILSESWRAKADRAILERRRGITPPTVVR